jgi:hypothetical protein
VTSSVCPAAANPVRRAVPSGKPFKVYWDGTKTNVVENVEKRTEKVLPLLAAFAAAKISDGCNCLGIQPKATTTKTIAAATSVRSSPSLPLYANPGILVNDRSRP